MAFIKEFVQSHIDLIQRNDGINPALYEKYSVSCWYFLMWHALSDVDLANSVQFLSPWIAAVSILVLQDKGVLNHCFMV